MKILVHAINFSPEEIGCAKYTTELVNFLESRGHRLEVVTAPPHYPGWHARPPYSAFAHTSEWLRSIRVNRCPIVMKRNGGGVWRLLAPLSFAFFAAPVVLWRALRFRPNVVLCVEPTFFSAPASILAARLVGARVALHVQDLEVDAAFEMNYLNSAILQKFGFAIESFVLKRFDRVSTISNKMRNALLAKGLAPDVVAVLQNWVDINSIKPMNRQGNSYRRELGLSDRDFVVLYAGHLGVKQALDVVLDAATELSKQEDICFVIVGDGPAKAQLQKVYGGLPRVRFLPLQPIERLNELLNLADLHVLPQLKGAADLVFPSKLAGMLASGRPVAATADPGTELYHVLQHAALITPSGEPKALAHAILRSRSEDMSERLRCGARIAASLDAAELLPRFEALLEKLVQSSDSNRRS